MAQLQNELASPDSPLVDALHTHMPYMEEINTALDYTCPRGAVMRNNKCFRCPVDEFAPEVGDSCRPCATGQTNNLMTDGCICKPDHFNSTRNPDCYEGDWVSPFQEPAECKALKDSRLKECVVQATGNEGGCCQRWHFGG